MRIWGHTLLEWRYEVLKVIGDRCGGLQVVDGHSMRKEIISAVRIRMAFVMMGNIPRMLRMELGEKSIILVVEVEIPVL